MRNIKYFAECMGLIWQAADPLEILNQ